MQMAEWTRGGRGRGWDELGSGTEHVTPTMEQSSWLLRNLLDSEASSAQCHLDDLEGWMVRAGGDPRQRAYMYMYITDSCHCTAETNLQDCKATILKKNILKNKETK